MLIGNGWLVKQERERHIKVRTLPLCGPLLYRLLWRPKPVTNDAADNMHQFWVQGSGGGKTRNAAHIVQDAYEAGWGGIIVDAIGALRTFALRFFASRQLSPDRCIIIDPTLPRSLGHPILKLIDGNGEEIDPYELVEKMVVATALLSESRYGAGFRQLDLGRRAFHTIQKSGRPMTDLDEFLMDDKIRDAILQQADDASMDRFWKGYVPKLPKDAVEALRNKWSGLFGSPLTRPFFASRNGTVDFFEAMQRGVWMIVNLSENRLESELRSLFGQLIQCALKTATLQREAVEERPPYLALFDEYQQYKSSLTHNDLLRTSRNMGLGICLFCQDTGSFTDQEFYALTNNCDTVGVGKCADHDGKAMAAVTLHPRGNTYKDWEETRTNSINDELAAYAHLLDTMPAGRAFVRVRPKFDGWYVELPYVEYPESNPAVEWAFIEAVAKRWFWKPSRKTS
jgi:hypothetical protein